MRSQGCQRRVLWARPVHYSGSTLHRVTAIHGNDGTAPVVPVALVGECPMHVL